MIPTSASTTIAVCTAGCRATCGKNGTAKRRNPYVPIFSRIPARRSEEHTSELQSHSDLVCRLLLEKKKKKKQKKKTHTTQIKSNRHKETISTTKSQQDR